MVLFLINLCCPARSFANFLPPELELGGRRGDDKKLKGMEIGTITVVDLRVRGIAMDEATRKKKTAAAAEPI